MHGNASQAGNTLPSQTFTMHSYLTYFHHYLITNRQFNGPSKSAQRMAQKKIAQATSAGQHITVAPTGIPQQCEVLGDSCKNSSRGRQLAPVKLQLPSSC